MDQPFCTQQAAGVRKEEDLQEDDAPYVVSGPFPPLVMNVGEDVVAW
jgi:hypothetical protein